MKGTQFPIPPEMLQREVGRQIQEPSETGWGSSGTGDKGTSPAWSCSPYHVFQLPTSEQG